MKKLVAALLFSGLTYAMFATSAQAGDDDASKTCPLACARIGACCGSLCC